MLSEQLQDRLQTLDPNTSFTEQVFPRNEDEKMAYIMDFTEEKGVEGVKGLSNYIARIMACLSRNDILFVTNAIENMVQESKRHLIELGIFSKFGAPEVVGIEMNDGDKMYDAIQEAITNNTREDITQLFRQVVGVVPFIHSERGRAFCQEIPKLVESEKDIHFERTGNISEYANNKGHAMRDLRSRGVRVPEGGMGHSKSQALEIAKSLHEKGANRFILKKTRSASAMGVLGTSDKKPITLENIGEFLDQISEDEYATGLLVEQHLGEVEHLPGVVIHVAPGPSKGNPLIRLLSASDQKVDEDTKEHIGNIYPLSYWDDDMEKGIIEYALWLDEIGAYGVAGLDFAVAMDEHSNRKSYAIDPNVRITGSTHNGLSLFNIAGTCNADNFAIITDNNLPICNKEMSVQEMYDRLKRAGLLYDMNKQRGVFINNSATAEAGKIQVTIIERVDTMMSTEEKHESVSKLWERCKQVFAETQQTPQESHTPQEEVEKTQNEVKNTVSPENYTVEPLKPTQKSDGVIPFAM